MNFFAEIVISKIQHSFPAALHSLEDCRVRYIRTGGSHLFTSSETGSLSILHLLRSLLCPVKYFPLLRLRYKEKVTERSPTFSLFFKRNSTRLREITSHGYRYRTEYLVRF